MRPAPSARSEPGEYIPRVQRRVLGVEPAQVHEQLAVGEGGRGAMREMNRQRGLADPGDPVDRRDHHRRAFLACGQGSQACEFRLPAGKPQDVMRQLGRDQPPAADPAVSDHRPDAQQTPNGAAVQAATCQDRDGRPILAPPSSPADLALAEAASGTRIHPVAAVSFTITWTWRYEPGSAAGSCRTTSVKYQSDTISASTPGDAARADRTAGASASRNT